MAYTPAVPVPDMAPGKSDFKVKRVDEVCGLLAEKGTELDGRGQTTWKDPFGSCGYGFAMLQPG